MMTSLSSRQKYSVIAAGKRLNIWSGSVRSGKTVASQVAWLRFIRNGPEGPLLMVGKTNRTLKRNILDPLEEFLGPGRMTVSTGAGEAIILGRKVYLVGANDERAESKIRGITLAGLYGDELTLWPRSFWNMSLSRLSLPGSKLFGTTNADAPLHWLKKGFIDRERELNLVVFNFKLTDNPFLDPDYIRDLKKEYTGLWKKRYIDGLWVAAEGPIYDMFDEDENVVDAVPPEVMVSRRFAAVDYGTSNPFVCVLFGEGSDGNRYVLNQWRWDSKAMGRQMTDAQYRIALEEWMKEQAPEVDIVYVDPSAASFITECYQGWLPVVKASNDVINGIRVVSSAFANRTLKFVRSTTEALLESVQGYAWDPKAQKRGVDEPLKADDHDCDALRYGVYSEARTSIDTSETGFN